MRHGIYLASGGPYVVRNNNLHDLIIGIRSDAEGLTLGENTFANNSTDVLQ